MATIDSVTTTTDAHADDSHGHDHDHPSWLAHHFDSPEQQFDSGKLGIWLFLVTEILFFSGMFCAYAIFRMLRPEVFEGCSQFLNTKLGAINTGVLLFSSLTMAWAVRCSQTEEHKKLVALIATTLSCAMVFLGVKSIEYSHKWGMGLLPPGSYFYSAANEHPTAQQLVEIHGFSESMAYFLTNSLYFICAPFALVAVGVLVWLIVAKVSGNAFQYAWSAVASTTTANTSQRPTLMVIMRTRNIPITLTKVMITGRMSIHTQLLLTIRKRLPTKSMRRWSNHHWVMTTPQ